MRSLKLAAFATAAIVALSIAGAAQAAPQTVIDVNLGYSSISQLSNNTTRQASAAVSLVGGKLDNSSLDTDALDANNMADVTEDISDLAGGATYEGEGGISTIDQQAKGVTHQAALAVGGVGGNLSSSSMSTVAAALQNAATVDIHIH